MYRCEKCGNVEKARVPQNKVVVETREVKDKRDNVREEIVKEIVVCAKCSKEG